ncbi:MAG: ABC transporter permease [Acidimicrobiales bacterium]
MTPTWAWARRALTRERRAGLALVLLIGISGAVVLTSAAGARRTGSAFDRFLETSNTADVQFQYSPAEDVDDEALTALHAQVLAALREDPDVVHAAPVYMTVGFTEGVEYDLGIFAGPDPALFHEMEIPTIVDGRLPDPSNPNEVMINRFTQGLLGVEPGDVVTVGTFTAEQFGGDEDVFVEPAGPVLELEVTGIGVLAYDLADPEFTGFFGTPAFHEEHWGEVGGIGPLVQVTTTPGTDAIEVVHRATEGFELEERIYLPQSQQAQMVEDGTRVLEVGLWAFAAVAGLAAVVVAAQALRRRMAETAVDLPTLRAMGMTSSQCAAALALTVLPAAAVGGGLAVLLSIAGSAAMPIGEARRAEPSPGIEVDLLALGVGALLLFALLAASVLLGAVRTTRTGSSGTPMLRARRPSASLLVSGRFSPASQLGVAMALDPGEGRTAVPVRSALVGAVFGVAGIVGAATFGAGLDHLISEPSTSGWNWTFAPDVAEADVAPLLEVAGVEDVGVLHYAPVEAAGEQMYGFSMTAERGAPSFTVVRGRMPAGPREVAVGPKTADKLGVASGDTIVLADPAERDGPREAVVVGEVLMPTFDDNLFNEGLVLTPDSLAAVRQTDGRDEVVVTFAEGVDDEVAAQRVRAVLPDGLPVYAFPSPPPDVANLSGVQFLPRLLGLFLGLLALAAIAHALATSVRRRRHDLGIVRSLGFVARDVLRAIVALSWTMVAVGLTVGIPLGMAAGRLAWRVVADGIGVRASATLSLTAVIAVAAAAWSVGAVLSLPAGATAARQRAVDALRVE